MQISICQSRSVVRLSDPPTRQHPNSTQQLWTGCTKLYCCCCTRSWWPPVAYWQLSGRVIRSLRSLPSFLPSQARNESLVLTRLIHKFVTDCNGVCFENSWRFFNSVSTAWLRILLPLWVRLLFFPYFIYCVDYTFSVFFVVADITHRFAACVPSDEIQI